MYRMLLSFLFASAFASAQKFPDLQSDGHGNSFSSAYYKEYPQLHYSYNDTSQIHDYSGNWDLDGDGKNDSICFVGTGGAHLYYHLKIILSASGRSYEFPSFEIDFPYLQKPENLCKDKSPAPLSQFAVSDFDHAGLNDIYLNLDFQASIPHQWKRKGVTSHQIILHYEKGKFAVHNFSGCN